MHMYKSLLARIHFSCCCNSFPFSRRHKQAQPPPIESSRLFHQNADGVSERERTHKTHCCFREITMMTPDKRAWLARLMTALASLNARGAIKCGDLWNRALSALALTRLSLDEREREQSVCAPCSAKLVQSAFANCASVAFCYGASSSSLSLSCAWSFNASFCIIQKKPLLADFG
jgi:hypothetical protein